jgi:hypothetical protein
MVETTLQEACRKDVEVCTPSPPLLCSPPPPSPLIVLTYPPPPLLHVSQRAFGVLQARWSILAHPSRFWYCADMHNIAKCCVILHNMIIASGQEDDAARALDKAELDAGAGIDRMQDRCVAGATTLNRVLGTIPQYKDKVACNALRSDLIAHISKKRYSCTVPRSVYQSLH